MAHCPSCDSPLVGNSPRFCASCGEALPREEEDAGPREELLFAGHPAVLASAGEFLLTVLTVGIALLFFWLRSLGRSYRITTQRIVIEHGILNKRLEQIDLSRVMDFVVERPFGQRMMGTGNIVMATADRTTPEVRIDGIRVDVLALYEELRAAAELERHRRGVRVLDVE